VIEVGCSVDAGESFFQGFERRLTVGVGSLVCAMEAMCRGFVGLKAQGALGGGPEAILMHMTTRRKLSSNQLSDVAPPITFNRSPRSLSKNLVNGCELGW
jgi:hypothetical protein